MKRADLVEYLLAEYKTELAKQESELTTEAEEMFKSFLDFCRHQLKNVNPAIGVCVLEQGLGLKLADTREVALVNLPVPNMGYNAVMPVTLPPMHPAASGVNDIRSVPIFGVDQQ